MIAVDHVMGALDHVVDHVEADAKVAVVDHHALEDAVADVVEIVIQRVLMTVKDHVVTHVEDNVVDVTEHAETLDVKEHVRAHVLRNAEMMAALVDAVGAV